MKFVSSSETVAVSKLARDRGLLDQYDSSAIFISLDVLDNRLNILKDAFPENSLHAIAIKTNPLQSVLRHILSRGFGLEAASFAELQFGIAAGAEPGRMVFDSPAKSRVEIEQLSRNFRGCRVNADSIEELTRYVENPGLKLGLRINPAVTSKAKSSMNVGGAYSKFGEPVDNGAEIVATCLNIEALDCLHLHIGSQAHDYSPNVEAIASVVDLASFINEKAGRKKITTIDIGGGFPVNYSNHEEAFHITDYAKLITDRCPEFLSGDFDIVTEFGRYVHANAAWCLSDIEYVKTNPAGVTITSQLGADMFLRESYNPSSWFHEMEILDNNFDLKRGDKTKTRIGGPLCFGGDYIGESQELVEAEQGDKLLIKDVGANTFSLWSRHCSRPFPKVISYSIERDEYQITKNRESDESLLRFWS